MSFEQKVKEINKIHNTCNDVLKIFKVNNYQELEDLYNKDDTFIENFFDKFFSQEAFLNNFYLDRIDFLNTNSQKVISYIKFATKNRNFPDDFFKQNDNNYKYKDFTIDDILEISRFLNNPPYPLTKYYLDDEDQKEKHYKLKEIHINSLYKPLNSLKTLFDLVLNDKGGGDIKITMNSNKTYQIHSWILSEYNYFQNSFKFKELSTFYIDSDNEKIVESILGFLYGVEISSEFTDDEYMEIAYLADYYDFHILSQICNIYLDKTDLKERFVMNERLKLFKIFTDRYLYDYYINLYNLDNDIVNLFKFDIIEAINKNDDELLIKVFDNFKNYLELKTTHEGNGFCFLIKTIDDFKIQIL